MSNPLALFRKHQKILLGVFGVALMFVFTIGGIVSQWLGSSSTRNENEVVVKLKLDPAARSVETLRESDLQNMRHTRLFLQEFMKRINALAAQRGATPQRSLGIPNSDDERSLLQTMILSQKAEELGVVVSDDAIVEFLERYTENYLKPGEFASELYTISRGRMSQSQFFNAMRKEMLALRFMDLFQRGIFPATPAASWDFYQRLNRQVRIEAVPFNVAQYLDRVNDPSDAEIIRTYETGKDRYAFPSLPEPGFKRRKKVSLQYVKADLEPFLNQEKEKITAEAIEIYYNDNKEQFRNVQLPTESEFDPAASAADAPATDQPDSGDLPPGDLPPGDLPPGDLPPGDLPSDDLPPGDLPPGDADSADDAASDDAPGAGSTTSPTEANGAEPTDETGSADTSDSDRSAEDGESSSDVSDECGPLQDDASEEDDDSSSDESVDSTEDNESAPVDASGTDDVNSQDSTPPVAGDEAAETDDANIATENSDDDLDEILSDVETTADSAQTDPADLGELPDEPTQQPTEAAQAEFKSLEEVADQIRTELATALAVERMEDAIDAARRDMLAYNGAYIVWEVSPDRDTTPVPTPPRLFEIAAQNGLSAGEIPLVNIIEIQETDPLTDEPRYPISQSYDQNFTPFAQLAFADDLRMYEARSIRGQLRDLTYVYWKTGETPEETPTLDECRDEVVRDLKMQAALTLAKKDAEASAEQLRRNNQTPKDAYRNAPDRRVIEAGPFSWMTPASVPYLPPQISRIPNIPYPGPKFMKAVFSLQQGEIGVAVDNPETTVYVVYLNAEVSNMNQLRDAFFRTGFSYEIAQMGLEESRDLLREWYDGYEKQLDVEWVRDPQPDRRQR